MVNKKDLSFLFISPISNWRPLLSAFLGLAISKSLYPNCVLGLISVVEINLCILANSYGRSMKAVRFHVFRMETDRE